LTLLVWSSDL